jgi:hypothetical protein
MAQDLVVALLVVGCFVYALWSLAPKALRRWLANALLKLPLPALLQQGVQSAAQQQGGCGGCGGCAPSARAGVSAPLVFHPRAARTAAPDKAVVQAP